VEAERVWIVLGNDGVKGRIRWFWRELRRFWLVKEVWTGRFFFVIFTLVNQASFAGGNL